MIPLAHVAGVPVEELVLYAPAAWVAIGAVGARLIARKGRR